MSEHPTLQIVLRDGIIDLGWGHPDPALLPVEAMRRASADALDRHGADALAYGHAAGAGPLRAWLRRRIAAEEGRDPGPDGIMLTGGNSHAIDQACTLLTRPGDAVLVESPTYHLAVRILRDHPLELVPVPADSGGLRVDAAEEAIARLRRAGTTPRMLYCVPTYHNPTGVSLAPERRAALVELAAREGVLVLEDDVYRDLGFEGPPPPSLWSLDTSGSVVRMGSFAKTLAPGLRLGWLTARPEVVARITEGGLLDSGGGTNHFTSLVVAALCEGGAFPAQLERLRAAYGERARALAAALAAELPPGSAAPAARGGFFTWVVLPEGWDAGASLARAEELGVSYIPGAKFHIGGGGERTLRMAHSLYPPAQLAEAAARLGAALRG